MPRSLEMGKTTPAQLRNETRLAVERIRLVVDRITELGREGKPPPRSDVAALAGAARTAHQTFEALADAGPATRKMAALAAELQAVAEATLHAGEQQDAAERLSAYALIIGRLVARLAFLADVPLTVDAAADEPPAEGPLN